MVFFMPPFLEFLEAKTVAFGGIQEIRYVMYECMDLGGSMSCLEICLCTLMLPERVEFANQEVAVSS